MQVPTRAGDLRGTDPHSQFCLRDFAVALLRSTVAAPARLLLHACAASTAAVWSYALLAAATCATAQLADRRQLTPCTACTPVTAGPEERAESRRVLRGAGAAADEGPQVARAGAEQRPMLGPVPAKQMHALRCTDQVRKARARHGSVCACAKAGCCSLLQGAIATRGEGLYEGLDW